MPGLWLIVAGALMAPQGAPKAITPDPLFSELGQCAPATYDAAVACLDRALPAKDRAALAQPDGMARFFVGIWIINNWGLGSGGPLFDSLRARGSKEPADMADTLLDGVVALDRQRLAKPAQSGASR